APVAPDLARDRRWRTLEPPRDVPQRAASTELPRDLFPLGTAEHLLPSPPSWRSDAAARSQEAEDRARSFVESPSDIAHRLPGLPSSPQLNPLLRREPTS